MPPGKSNLQKILVRGTNWIGDAVMTTPALQRLRSSFPRAQITLLATPRTTRLFEGSPYFDDVIEYRRREEGVKALFAAAKELRARRYDLAVLFQNAFEAALLARLGGVKLRIGFAEQGRGFLLTHQLYRGPGHRNRHQTLDYLEIVAECERACLGSNFCPSTPHPLPSLTANNEQRNAAAKWLEQFPARPLIALNTAATNSHAKCWPADRFAALADRLVEQLEAQIIFIGAEAERENAENVRLQMKQPGALNLAGQTSMAELIGLLDACDLVVSNDTGPAHIAAALGRPTLTIFGPTNEFETSPTGPRSQLIRAEGIECARCMHRECPIDHRCMTRIEVVEVLEKSHRLIEKLRADETGEKKVQLSVNNS